MTDPTSSLFGRLKNLVIGAARSPREAQVFHHLSLIAFFAWIGLGADGLSSSCYGPEEAFKQLGRYPSLGLVVAAFTALTIFVISASYMQIIEVFPSGGGGYLVASKLLSPGVGMVAGSALMVDYVLTIAVSVAVGVNMLTSLSFMPPECLQYKVEGSLAILLALTLINLRGVKESVGLLTPIFVIFVITYAFAIAYAIGSHAAGLPTVWNDTVADARAASAEFGVGGMIFLIFHAYSMGAGTYTGIEAVSNGMAVLREPRVRTAKRTMTYMWISLAITAGGLMVAYLLLAVKPEGNKTLNAVLMESLTARWGTPGAILVIVTLVSSAALLFVAAQTGFLGGPRVLANMAQDRWFPSRLSMLSDRLVTQNGIILMSAAAIVTLLLTRGDVDMLIVLYSINVFITFVLSQTGMVRHWWVSRRTERKWLGKLLINGTGLVMSAFILVWVIIAKFFAGGWATLLVTGSLVIVAALIHRHYTRSRRLVDQFNSLAMSMLRVSQMTPPAAAPLTADPSGKTAVLLVSGFNGMGIHSMLNIFRFFGETFRNFVFLQVGQIDTGTFKGADEVKNLEEHIRKQAEQYVQLMRSQGHFAEAWTSIGADIVDETETLAAQVFAKYPQSIFFAGQLLFPYETFFTRLLHNNITFALQRRLYHRGIPFMILPIRVQTTLSEAKP